MSWKRECWWRFRKAVAPLWSASLLMFAGVSLLAGSRALAADTATVISKSNCKFSTTTAALAFGTLDPGNPVDVTRTATLTVRCGGSAANATYLITDDDGLHQSGAERMQHALTSTEFLPYSFSYAPASATILKNADQTITVTGTVTGANYQNALAGSYSDTVTLTLAP